MFGLIPFERRNGMNTYNLFNELVNFDRRFLKNEITNFKTDIIDNGNEYILEADLPGYKKEDISIKINDGYLTISAKHDDEKSEKNKDGEYVRRERSCGMMSRSFDVSEINEEAISAGFENGVLKLTLPKKQAEKDTVKEISIE